MAELAEGSIDLIACKNTTAEINAENTAMDAKKKINNKKKAMIAKEEKKTLNPVPTKRASSTKEIKVKNIKVLRFKLIQIKAHSMDINYPNS